MKSKQYKKYLKNKENHLEKINGMSKKDAKYFNKEYYVPIIKKQLLAIKKSNGVYELDGWHLYPTSRFAMNKKNCAKRIELDKFIESYIDPNESPFKNVEKIEKEIENEEGYYKRKPSKLGEFYSFLYCCGCKRQVMATEIKQKNKYFYQCECGLKSETDNNPDFPNPIGNIPTEKMKGARTHLKKMLKSIIKKKIKTEVEVFLKVRNELGYWIGYEKSIQECRKVYKKIQDFINQDLINVKRIL